MDMKKKRIARTILATVCSMALAGGLLLNSNLLSAKAAASTELSLTTETTSVQPGDEFTVNVDLTKCDEIAGLTIWVHYDSECLSVESVERVNSVLLKPTVNKNGVDPEGKITDFVGYSYADPDNSSGTGTLMKIKLKVNDDAEDGDTTLSFAKVDGSVSLSDTEVGHIDEIDTNDLTITIAKQVETTTEEETTTEQETTTVEETTTEQETTTVEETTTEQETTTVEETTTEQETTTVEETTTEQETTTVTEETTTEEVTKKQDETKKQNPSKEDESTSKKDSKSDAEETTTANNSKVAPSNTKNSNGTGTGTSAGNAKTNSAASATKAPRTGDVPTEGILLILLGLTSAGVTVCAKKRA